MRVIIYCLILIFGIQIVIVQSNHIIQQSFTQKITSQLIQLANKCSLHTQKIVSTTTDNLSKYTLYTLPKNRYDPQISLVSGNNKIVQQILLVADK